jgi:hypothetical protein
MGFNKDKFGLVDDQKRYVHHFGILEKRENMIYTNQLHEWQQDKRKILQQMICFMNSGLEWRIIVRFVMLQRCYFSLGIWEEGTIREDGF